MLGQVTVMGYAHEREKALRVFSLSYWPNLAFRTASDSRRASKIPAWPADPPPKPLKSGAIRFDDAKANQAEWGDILYAEPRVYYGLTNTGAP
jgi:hypothetical protein